MVYSLQKSMVRTISGLILALVSLPVVAYYYDQPLDPLQRDALWLAVRLMLAVAAGAFVVSEITRNYSQVDKLWSIMPVIYCWHFARASGWDPRLTLMAGLVTVWGLRLSFNFARRGGYHWLPWKGEEDYRWAVLRKEPYLKGRLRWGMFNLFFISLYQQSLVLLFTLPALLAMEGRGSEPGFLDGLATVLMLGFILLETVADQQQYNFQETKYRRIREGAPLTAEQKAGFCTQGLWAKSRHPNYAAEQLIWLAFYLFSVAATGRWLNWSLAGAVLLMLLFLGSSDFSEKITAAKYPAYRDYQQRVPRFWGITKKQLSDGKKKNNP